MPDLPLTDAEYRAAIPEPFRPPKPPERTYRRGFRFACQDGVDLYIEEAKDGGVSLQLSDANECHVVAQIYLTAKQWEDLRGLYVRGEL